MALALCRQGAAGTDPEARQRLEWAGSLHEIGFSVSHSGFHKHGAYILQNADMPGFGTREQRDLALLVLGCRGSLAKMRTALDDPTFRLRLLALRLAVIFHHARRPIEPPRITFRFGREIRFAVPAAWRKAHPLTAHQIAAERTEWENVGFRWLPAR
jgi:exopolyphosphatase/guanosine-5'-triphosphate,3'-diphosphate pyrophosphatase